MNDKGVCRIALAQPGLLKKIMAGQYFPKGRFSEKPLAFPYRYIQDIPLLSDFKGVESFFYLIYL